MRFRPAILLALAAAVAAGPPEEPFRQAATSPLTHVRARAAASPPGSLDQDDLKALVALLSDRDLLVRRHAASGLALRADQAGERGARALAAAALDPFSGLEGDAAAALAAYGTTAYGAFRDTLRGRDPYAASRLWRLFRACDAGRDRCLEFIRRALVHEDDPGVRAMAALVMRHAELADRDTFADLWTVARSDAPASVRAASLRAFGVVGALLATTDETGAGRRFPRFTESLPFLREMASEETLDADVRAAAAEALDYGEGRRRAR